MAAEDDPFDDSAGDIWCRHLILCRVVWFDPSRPDDGFSLGKLLVQTRPPEGEPFPLMFDRLFLFTQMTGPSGAYTLRARLVRIGTTAYGEEVEEPVLRDGGPVEYGPWDIELVRED